MNRALVQSPTQNISQRAATTHLHVS